eukprot:4231947-Alexandrium_andersonii.AAC.1
MSVPISSSTSSVLASGVSSVPMSDAWSLVFTACVSDAAGPPPVNIGERHPSRRTVRLTGKWVSEGQVGKRPLRGPSER